MDLHGATVLVTGGSRGIGAATARSMAAAGATVLLLARTESALETVVESIEAAGGRAAAFPVDLTDDEAVEAVAREITAQFGTPDVVVNNAGMGQFKPIEETTPAEAAAMIDVPYLTAFRVTHAFIDGMLERDTGRIVNVTSAASFVPWPGSTAYASARWALRGFAEALEADLGETGIGVSLVAATTVESPYWSHNPGSREKLPSIARLFGVLPPEAVAEAIVTAVREERRVVLVPRRFRLAALLARVVPSVFRWLTSRTGWRRTARLE